MTDEDRALVNSVNENHRRKDILHKGSLANTTRSRRKDAYHVPNVPVQGSEMNKTFSGNLCMLLKPTEKTTGEYRCDWPGFNIHSHFESLSESVFLENRGQVVTESNSSPTNSSPVLQITFNKQCYIDVK